MTFHKQMAQMGRDYPAGFCIGIDPHAASLPCFFKSYLKIHGIEDYLGSFSECVLTEAEGFTGAIKFQSAFFEQYGSAGMLALQTSMKSAKSYGFYTILDYKRGDINTTMTAYGRTAFEVYAADAVTVNPYMGFDVLSPIKEFLREGRGVYLLLLTSNPSAEIQAQMAPLILQHFVSHA